MIDNIAGSSDFSSGVSARSSEESLKLRLGLCRLIDLSHYLTMVCLILWWKL